MYFNYELYLSIFMFFISMFMFSWFFKHLLLTIISLEFMMISIMFNMYLLMVNFLNNYMLMFFLSISVCEGALALSLVVLMVRSYGNDYLNSLSLIKW